MKTRKNSFFRFRLGTLSVPFGMGLATALYPALVLAQVNSGSNGSDGAFNPTASVVIDMADHPDGIYQYTAVNIPAGVDVSFIPNARNTPVIWLVQGTCVIDGTVGLSGGTISSTPHSQGATGGPGGYSGGVGGTVRTPGQGPGGGMASLTADSNDHGFNASYGTPGSNCGALGGLDGVGQTYGNQFLVPIQGGSGGGGSGWLGGAGGGGAILIAASQSITLDGRIVASGGSGPSGGSGGAVRLVSSQITGSCTIDASGGTGCGSCFGCGAAGSGRIRIDALSDNLGGTLLGVVTRGFQPIILPAPGQGIQLAIESIAALPVPADPSGNPGLPAVTVPSEQVNPIAVVVRCNNVPLNSQVTVTAKAVNGTTASASACNLTGTQASSTATVSLEIPRGGGLLYATWDGTHCGP